MVSVHSPVGMPDQLSLVELVELQAQTDPGQIVFTVLDDAGAKETTINFGELHAQARAVANRLRALEPPPQRALLLFPTTIEYVTAFLGCLYAGVTAIPAFPLRLRRQSTRLHAIIKDAQSDVALTTTALLPRLNEWRAGSGLEAALRTMGIGFPETSAAPDAWSPRHPSPDDIAYLQYTSGSTQTPRGVMITHGNIMANLANICELYVHDQLATVVSWLPLYHDMGLVGALLAPIYANLHSVLMAPAAFTRRPLRWLEEIARRLGVVSAAPNFAYQLCIDRIPPHERTQLDLGSWQVAIVGAETVRPQTMADFVRLFAPRGFRAGALAPSYGLAEATVLVSG